MDTLPARSRSSITKQDLWHQHHVFTPPFNDIQHAYATRYSTTHTYKPPTSSGASIAPSLTSTSPFHSDQASGATHNHAYTHLRSLPSGASTYTEHYPRSSATAATAAAAASVPAEYERHDRLPAITFPSPITTTTAYYHDDIKHRPSAYTVSNRYAYNTPHSTTLTSTTHAAHITERPTSAPHPYHAPLPTTLLNGYTRNSAYAYTPEFPYNNALPRCRTGRFATEYDGHFNHSSHLAETMQRQPAEGVVDVSRLAGDEHTGFTRRMSAPPCDGVGTEHVGLRVFAGLVDRDAAGLGRENGWDEKQQLEIRGPAFDSTVPCVANGGLRQFYSTTAQRHYTASPQTFASASTAASSFSSALAPTQRVTDSGFTHNSHLIPATTRLNNPSTYRANAPVGRAIIAAIPNTLATDGRPSHADYAAPDQRRTHTPTAVDTRRTASAYSREHAVRVVGVDREERRWERLADGKFVQQAEAIERLEYMHPTVRAMVEVQLTEKKGEVKNYGADLDLIDRDWVPDEAEQKVSRC